MPRLHCGSHAMMAFAQQVFPSPRRLAAAPLRRVAQTAPVLPSRGFRGTYAAAPLRLPVAERDPPGGERLRGAYAAAPLRHPPQPSGDGLVDGLRGTYAAAPLRRDSLRTL